MQGDDGPEHAAEGGLLGFVAQEARGEERAGPAAEEGEEVEGAFGDSTARGDGSAFVDGEREEGDAGDEGVCGERDEEVNQIRDPARGRGGGCWR